ncbi:MAG: GNAT family N-acetyltransferase [Anaerolineaceae bacterium]|jgi:GNAT superfamily N-acetyltransferase
MTNLPVQIRPAATSDATVLVVLTRQLGYEVDAQGVADRLTHLLSIPGQAIFVAEADRNVIGWVHAFIVCEIETDLFAEIGGLVVDERWRNKGVGGLLMHRAEAWARENGMPLVRLRSNIIRETAHRFYSNLGYSYEKNQKVFTKKLG